MKKLMRNILEQTLTFYKVSSQAIKTKKGLRFDDKFYDLFSQKIGKYETGKFIEQKETKGYCYFFALILARAMPGCKLQIGTLHRLDRNVRDCYYEEFEHSWVEKGNFVYDTTTKMIFDKEFYYKNYYAEVLKTIDFEELKDTETFCSLGINAIKNRPELTDSLFLCEEMKEVSKDKFNKKMESVYDSSSKKIILEKFENFCNRR